MYVGDASDDWALDPNENPTPADPDVRYQARAWHVDDVSAITPDADGHLPAGDPLGDTFNTGNGFVELSSSDPADPGFAVYNYCQNGQCSYDSLVAHPPGSGPGTAWYIGSMNYDELKAYDRDGLGVPPRSNGRALVRTTNGDEANPVADTVWSDMTAVLDDPSADFNVLEGIHPDLRAAAFANNGETAFIGGDGGVYRIDATEAADNDQSQSCAARTWDYDGDGTDDPLEPDDLAQCQMLLADVPQSVTPKNDGLRTLQFQSVSTNPAAPGAQIFGGTQDNGTWSYDASRTPTNRWFESVGGDGGQSGFDQSGGDVRYHNYFDATPEVNFHGDDPTQWLATYDPLQLTAEARSFYTPFEVDPKTPGRLFTGLQHVWRTDDDGGNEADLVANGCLATDLDPFRTEPCGDWVEMGGDLTSAAFGPTRTGDYVVAVERAPSDAGTLWAATRTGRLFVTQNADDTPGAVQFRRIDTPTTPGRFVTGIAIDPADPNHAWISYTGYDAYTPTTPGHVLEATYDPTTHAATFKDLSYNLGDQPITALVVYGENGSLFAGTDFGVLELPAGSTEWIDAGTGGLPHVAVYGLVASDNGKILLAATHGRGAFSLELPPAEEPPPPPPPGETTPSAKLKKIKSVRLGHRSRIRGRATDEAGLQRVRLRFGDGDAKTVKTDADGRFSLRHAYDKKGRYEVHLLVVGEEGKEAKASRIARVRPPRRHHHQG
jgi:hypothetical protein